MAYDWQRGSQYLSDVLAGLSSGMLSRPQGGPPLAGFGMGLQNANQMLAMRQAQEQQSLRDELLRRQMAQQDKAFAEQEAAKKRAESGLARLLGQPDPRATPKFVGGAGSGPNSFQQPAATGPKPAWLTPDVESILSGMDPNEAFGFAAKLATDKPDTKNLQVSGGMQYDPNHPELGWTAIPGYTAQAAAIAAAGRAPVQPPKPDLITLYGPNGEKPRTFWSTDNRINDFINQGWSGAKPGADTERKIITLYSPDGKGMKSFYEGNPEIETRLGQGWTGEAAKPAAEKGLITLYGPNGDMKSYYEGSPEIAAAIGQGWTAEAPKSKSAPGLVTLTKDGQTKTITDNDPQMGMYLASGWIEAGKAPKAETTYQTLTGEALKAVNPNLDPAKTWKIGSDGSAVVVDKPEQGPETWKEVPAQGGRPGYLESSLGNRKPLPGNESGGAFKQENTLRDEFNTLTKDFRTVQDAYNKIQSTSPTGQGDMSLLYAYVKLLDPGSVVRESEFATAAQTGSLPQQVQGWATRLLSGEKLPPEVRAQFRKEAKGIYDAQKAGYDKQVQNYTTLAKNANVDPANVIVPYDVQYGPGPAVPDLYSKFGLTPPPGGNP